MGLVYWSAMKLLGEWTLAMVLVFAVNELLCDSLKERANGRD